MRGITLLMLACLALGCHESLGLGADTTIDRGRELPPVTDTDGDSISDVDEGRYEPGGAVDTDGDTIADYEDEDSDNDTIPDAIESGDVDTSTPPVDSDADGIPDYRDGDSDNNGVLDVDEGSADMDGDTVGDHADPDNDGDGIEDERELQGNPSMPVDSDGDAVPDYKDFDSDNDTISDRHEGDRDTDSDDIPDYLDLDTDCDHIPDSTEAGDEDIATAPVDTDADSVPDYRDPDSDNDGLSDRWESENGLNPYDEDTDGDGVPDLIEVGAGTDPLDAVCNPRTEGNFFFIMFYNDPADPGTIHDPEPTMDHLVFATDLQKADVFFALDSSGSMGGEINNLRTSLMSTVIPGVLAEVPNVWFGVGRFEDCGFCAHNMTMIQAMTNDIAAMEASLTGWSTCGGRQPSTQYLYALATGDLPPFLGWGNVTPTSWTCIPPGDVGWPCFRPDAMPIIVQFSDSDFSDAISSCTPSYNHDQAITALSDIGAKYIGVNSGSGTYSAHADMVVIATGTGSVDVTGSPIVFDISSDGTGLGAQVVDAIEILAHQVPVEVTFHVRDDPSDLVDTESEFMDYIEPSVAGGWPDPRDPTVICVSGLTVADERPPLDGRPDTFTSVLPGTPVCFDIYVKQNWTVPATPEPQTFLAEIDVMADGLTVLDTRDVYFLVPPTGVSSTTIVCED
jgi:hypothetical protein